MLKQSKCIASPETTSNGCLFGYLGEKQTVCSTAVLKFEFEFWPNFPILDLKTTLGLGINVFRNAFRLALKLVKT